ncbi:MAG: anthranilate synthase component I family protein [Pyrinomonadaceae bacterium]
MLELNPNTFDRFLSEAEKGNVVPVVRGVLADLHTPVSAFMRVAEKSDRAFLLESIEGGEKLARYSFLACDPVMTVRSRRRETVIETGEAEKVVPDQTLPEFLRSHFAENRLAERENLPPLCGGAVGFFAYGASRWFERVLDDGKPPETEDAAWMFFRNVLVFDRLKQRIEIVSVVLTDEAEGDNGKLRALYERAVGETERIEGLLLKSSLPKFGRRESSGEAAGEFQPNWPKQDFLRAVEAIRERILAGDCYQVVLSQRFRRRTPALPIDIYRALRTTNPSPYMFYLRLGDRSLIGASPEMLVRCTGPKLDYRPIAGTRPRGSSEAEDAALGEEMRADQKEVAEHVMLVDLGRNDLGRVAEYGSVEVAELMKIEKYSHVQHLVTSLRARLRDGFDRFDALASCFPAGTVSGAPKVKAMQIINELEPTDRSVYSGAIGYIDYASNLDTCIAIRTISLEAGEATIQAGAGIVADSVPENEYQETLNKARALTKAVEMAEEFSDDG